MAAKKAKPAETWGDGFTARAGELDHTAKHLQVFARLFKKHAKHPDTAAASSPAFRRAVKGLSGRLAQIRASWSPKGF